MIRYISSAALVLATLISAASPQLAAAQTSNNASAGTAAAAPANLITTEDPNITRRALEWFSRAQNGDIDQSQLSPTVTAKFTPQVTTSLKNQLAPLGKPLGIAFGGARPEQGSTVYRYVLAFAVGSIQEFVSFDKNAKVTGLVFAKNT